MKKDIVIISEASSWASNFLDKDVTNSNINYLVSYGLIKKHTVNDMVGVSIEELKRYYSNLNQRENEWKEELGEDLNWDLSFESLKEAETTKHVHRLHPYKGKFIPQLVEYFLDGHTDEYKKEVFFKKGDIILDPFCGSGTTLVQANELGFDAVGIDVSKFNALMSQCKVAKHDLIHLKKEIKKITTALKSHEQSYRLLDFENELNEGLKAFNDKHFPSPEYRRNIRLKKIDGREFGQQKESEFLTIYNDLIKKYDIQVQQQNKESFLDIWFIKNVRNEIDLVHDEINKIENSDIKNILRLILSRTMRSCRATTHSDLATLKEAVTAPYYCHKHFKICRPLFSILRWWNRYCKDTLKRLAEFDNLRTETQQICLIGDSRNINLLEKLEDKNEILFEKVKTKKIKGIFSSPPYVGVIDYHEQHAYAYDLFDFERKDELEIGPLFKGRGKAARDSYVEGISEVLNNCKKYLADDYDVFLVANDNYNLYPRIAEKAGMVIVNEYKRPVLNRTERNKNAYAEIIFHLKKLELKNE